MTLRPVTGPVFVLVMLTACGEKRAKVPDSRPLSTSSTGEERHEVRCEQRSACERKAVAACPHGYAVESEWHDEGTSVERERLQPPAPGSAAAEKEPRGPGSSWWHEKPSMALVVRCHEPPVR